MNFVQIGKHIVNMDQVTNIRLGNSEVVVEFAVTTDDGRGYATPHGLIFRDDEADAFLSYLIRMNLYIAMPEAQS